MDSKSQQVFKVFQEQFRKPQISHYYKKITGILFGRFRVESFFSTLHNGEDWELMEKFKKIYRLLNEDFDLKMEEADEVD